MGMPTEIYFIAGGSCLCMCLLCACLLKFGQKQRIGHCDGREGGELEEKSNQVTESLLAADTAGM